ncbi:hypothetical protein EYC98_17195, partial [Halieaceae bacterium IMCC14734]
YGDGSGVQALALNPDKSFALNHSYAVSGVYTVTVTVSDEDGGSTSASESVVFVNADPILSDLVVTPGVENGTITVTGTITDPGALDTFTIDIDWGDPLAPGIEQVSIGASATGSQTFELTHRYGDDNATDSYSIALTVTDDNGGTGVADTSVVITNVAPTLADLAVTAVAENGTTILSGTINDPGTLDTFTLVIDWGDNSSDTFTYGSNATGSQPFSLSHRYSDDNASDSYSISLTVTDDDGGAGNAVQTAVVTNAGPAVTGLVLSASVINEDESINLTGSFEDAGLIDTHTLLITWGDGTTTTLNQAALAAGTFSASHRYSDDRPSDTSSDVYVIGLTLTDDDGDLAIASTSVTVNNIAPVVDAGSGGLVDEGGTFSSTGSFTDPGTDTWTATVDYGDGSGEQVLTLNPDKTFALNHSYSDNGIYSVTVSVSDDDSGVGDAITAVTVNNVAPTVDAGAGGAIDEGGVFIGAGSFTDPGADAWTATVNYGDGTGVQALTLNPDKTFALNHIYADNGSYVITVSVSDDEAVGGDTATVSVSNVAPAVDAGLAGSVGEGRTFIGFGSFTDPGADNWTATVDYGDGSASQQLILTQNKTFALAHKYAEDGIYTVTVTALDGDGGAATDTAVVTVNNMVPEVNAGAAATIDEGRTFTSFGTFIDRGADSWTATVDYGDGSGVQVLALSSNNSFALNHNYADEATGTYTVTVVVTDDDGAIGVGTTTVNVDNIAPLLGGLLATAIDENGNTTLSGTIIDPGKLDSFTLDINWGDPLSPNNVEQFSFGPSVAGVQPFTLTHQYLSNNPGDSYTIGLAVTDDDAGLSTDTVIVDTAALRATSVTPGPSGVTITFSQPLDPSVLNLYDTQTGGLGAADITLVGDTVGAVNGSLILDAGLQTVTFVRTGGVLAADNYTLTLRSANDGFINTGGGLLDGNGDGIAGDDYVMTFTVSPSAAVTVSISDVARGPGQAVDVPATGVGLPVMLSDGTGVTSVGLTLTYDPSLLNVTGVTLGAALPGDAILAADLSVAGVVTVTISSGTGFGSGALQLLTLTATVPEDAPYGAKQLLDLSAVSINNGAISVQADDAVHVVAYLGDTTGNASYTSEDAINISQVVAELDTGFQYYPLLDPLILGDITGNGSLSSLDGTRILQEIEGFDRLEIPPLPSLSQAIVFGGLDPTLSIPLDLAGYSGDLITVPVWVDTLPVGLDALQIEIGFDAEVLVVEAIRPGEVTETFEIFLANSSTEGLITVDTASGHLAVPLEDGGILVEIDFRIIADAVSGSTVIDIQGARLNDSHYTLIPEPVVGPDGTDGEVTVLAQPLDTDSDSAIEAPLTVATTTYSIAQPLVMPDAGFTAASINVSDDLPIRDASVELSTSLIGVSSAQVLPVSPTGKSTELSNTVDGRGDNFTATQLVEAGISSTDKGAASSTGLLPPEGDRVSLEKTRVQGILALEIYENKMRHTRTLGSWSIAVSRDSSLPGNERSVDWYSPSSQAVFRPESVTNSASIRSSAYLPLATDGLS